MTKTEGKTASAAVKLTGMGSQRIALGRLDRNPLGQFAVETPVDVNLRQFFQFCLGRFGESRTSRARSAFSASVWELTETYCPAAIDIAPATRPASPAIRFSVDHDPAAATPTTRLDVDTIPSFAPSTAARSQPIQNPGLPICECTTS